MKYIKIAVIIAFILSLGVFIASKVREIQSADETLPEITSDRKLLEIPCDYTRDQLLEGLTAYDEKDGDLTSQIVAGDFSRFIEKGVCNVTYVVFDSGHQSASLTRKLKFTDYVSPRFTLSKPLVYTEGTGSYEETISRLGAVDCLDGDISEWIVQADTDVNYQTAGDYTMQAEVTNHYGDTVSVKLPIHVTEQGQALAIELTSPIVYIRPGEDIDPKTYLEGVYDSEGEELGTDVVEIDSSVRADTPGCYEIYYRAEDEQGRSGENWLTVVVQD